MINKIFNIKWKRFRFIFGILHLQKLKGIGSKVIGEEKHYIFWDFDNQKINEIKRELEFQQFYYNLGNIYIVSDKPFSYRAFCFSKRTFKEMLEIIIKTEGVDYGFFLATVKRKSATLRTCNKEGRIMNNQVITILYGKEHTEFPNYIKDILYESGSPNKIKVLSYGRN